MKVSENKQASKPKEADKPKETSKAKEADKPKEASKPKEAAKPAPAPPKKDDYKENTAPAKTVAASGASAPKPSVKRSTAPAQAKQAEAKPAPKPEAKPETKAAAETASKAVQSAQAGAKAGAKSSAKAEGVAGNAAVTGTAKNGAKNGAKAEVGQVTGSAAKLNANPLAKIDAAAKGIPEKNNVIVDTAKGVVDAAKGMLGAAAAGVVDTTKGVIDTTRGAIDTAKTIAKELGIYDAGQNRPTKVDGTKGAAIQDGTIETVRPGDVPPGVHKANQYDAIRLSKVDPFTQEAKIYHVNGIRSEADTRKNDALMLASMTGKPVQLVNNNTYGGARDVLECASQLIGGQSNPPTQAMARELAEDLRDIRNRGVTDTGDKNIIISAHSQGGIVATAALSEALGQLKKDGWTDEQIRAVVSQHVQVNLMGSPADPRLTPANPRGQAIGYVPPSGDPKPDQKRLDYYFGDPGKTREYFSTDQPQLPKGPGFNMLRHPDDPVAEALKTSGVDDKAKLDALNEATKAAVVAQVNPLASEQDRIAARVALLGAAASVGFTAKDIGLDFAERDINRHDVSGMNAQGQLDMNLYNESYLGRIRSAYGEP